MAKIYDESVLDEKADFTLSLELPAGATKLTNADGTPPAVTVKVDATTFRAACLILRNIHDADAEDYVYTAIEERGGAKFFVDDPEAALTPEFEAELDALMSKEDDEFFATNLSYTLTSGEDDENPLTVNLTVNAPSIVAGARALLEISSPKRVQGLIVGLMPDEEDEDDYGWDDDLDENDGDDE